MILYETIRKNLKANLHRREILIWGAYDRGKQIADFLTDIKISISGYIDKSKYGNSYGSLPIFEPSIIDPQKYFIIVSLIEHNSVYQILDQAGYIEYNDYIYPDKQIKIIQSKNHFEDNMGNNIHGTISLENTNSFVQLSAGSSLVIHKNVTIGKNTQIYVGWNSHLELCENVILYDDCVLKSLNNSNVIINNGCRIYDHSCVLASNNSDICIDNRVYIGHHAEIRIVYHSSLNIGKDTLVSSDVKIRGGNGHAIIHLDENSIQDVSRNVYISEKNWICMRAVILGGTKTGSHSIIGANSLINKEFPNHVLIAGTPGKIIREHVDWHAREDITWDEYLAENQNI